MSNYLIKHAKLLKRYFILSFKRAIEYRFSFYFNILNLCINLSVWIIFWQIILDQTGTFKGWTMPMMILLLGFFFFQESLWIVFWRNWNYSEDVINGNIIMFLVKPLNPYLGLIWKYMDVARLGEMSVGFGVVVWTVFYYDFSFSLIKFVLAFVICIIGAFVSMNLFALANVFSFWTGRTYFLRNMLGGFFVLEKIPVNITPLTIKAMYTFLIPVIFIATYPALVIAEFSVFDSLQILGLELLVAVLSYYVFYSLWCAGIKRLEAHGG